MPPALEAYLDLLSGDPELRAEVEKEIAEEQHEREFEVVLEQDAELDAVMATLEDPMDGPGYPEPWEYGRGRW